MKKVILKLDLHDDKAKQKAMKKVTSLPGIDSIAMDMKDKKLTVIGDVDPVDVVRKLRKLWHTDILSVGPVKEPEKKEEPKKEEPKKEEPKKEEPKKEEPKKEPIPNLHLAELTYRGYYPPPPRGYYPPPPIIHRSVEEDPNACVIS